MSFASCRKKTGLTQMQVAKEIDVTQPSVSFWESGISNPKASHLCKLAALYGVTVDELLKED